MNYEICVASVEAARLADRLPIKRIETCVALEYGGLTPNHAFVAWIEGTFNLEQHVLIRQRAGGFSYSYDEILVMRDNILQFRDLGVAGVVVGALTSDRELDTNSLMAWHRAANDLDLTFHRAFDEVKNWKTAMDKLVDLGFKRILTSGQASAVDKGLDTLREMVAYADGRIEIMAGGGVRPENKQAVIATGVNAIHFSGTKQETVDPESMFGTSLSQVDEKLLTELCKQ